MSLRKCDKCGEMYADSYRACPFCAEDEAFYNGTARKKKRRDAQTKSPSIVGPVLILVFVLLLGVGVWHFFGDNIQARLFPQEEEPVVQSTGDDAEPILPPSEETEAPVAEALSIDAVLNMAVGENHVLEPVGGSSYEWSSSDPAVATVTQAGEVKAVTMGTTIITVTDVSGEAAVCSVTVREAGEETPGGTQSGGTQSGGTQSGETQTGGTQTGGTQTGGTQTGGTQTGGTSGTKVDISKLKLSVPDYNITLEPTAPGQFDITMQKSEAFAIRLEGASGSVAWTSGNSNVVTVDSEGNLKPVGSGSATVTGKVGDATVSVLVRVS